MKMTNYRYTNAENAIYMLLRERETLNWIDFALINEQANEKRLTTCTTMADH